MSCFYCTHYTNIEEECEMGTLIKTGSESFDCPDYQYNGEVHYD